AMLADRVERRLEQIDIAYARYLDRILESQKYAFACPLLGRDVEQVAAFVGDFTGRHTKRLASGQDVRERALAGTVRSHDCVHFAGDDTQIDAAQDGLAINADVEVFDFKHGHLSRYSLPNLRRAASAPRPRIPSAAP